MLNYAQFNIRLPDHYVIFVDAGQDNAVENTVIKALREIGAAKTTRHGFTLNRSRVRDVSYLVSILGPILTDGTSIWIIYEEANEMRSVVVSPDAQ